MEYYSALKRGVFFFCVGFFFLCLLCGFVSLFVFKSRLYLSQRPPDGVAGRGPPREAKPEGAGGSGVFKHNFWGRN